jgi:hypothetical protein
MWFQERHLSGTSDTSDTLQKRRHVDRRTRTRAAGASYVSRIPNSRNWDRQGPSRLAPEIGVADDGGVRLILLWHELSPNLMTWKRSLTGFSKFRGQVVIEGKEGILRSAPEISDIAGIAVRMLILDFCHRASRKNSLHDLCHSGLF